jgi:hypothetical protein
MSTQLQHDSNYHTHHYYTTNITLTRSTTKHSSDKASTVSTYYKYVYVYVYLSRDRLRVQSMHVLASGQYIRVPDWVTSGSWYHVLTVECPHQTAQFIVCYHLLQAELYVGEQWL